jgi:uncharacterized protein with von Willebrand factor type A (vWA) domain
VVGDAGATRGHLDSERVRQVRTFLQDTRVAFQPVAWLNPMPEPRWRGTTAERIARLPHLAMSELNDEGLVQAVDHLRGKRAS